MKTNKDVKNPEYSFLLGEAYNLNGCKEEAIKEWQGEGANLMSFRIRKMWQAIIGPVPILSGGN